ncbi:M10 family metallopeptidase C-terminal domain-containing protein [Tropicibacter sp. R15_0]|uniref:M10 family metallopeptidase n=1 Tax=Tropicibacter sp. R15_0 TaxID=2821101 RepID=UPI001ADD5F9E|nr:M10 family metallopeptidase C-terminal domain-containing protein [Tropicibacter sp. R15_0]MBO9468055.1 M10 family metallopeptidase C-terminal domain-containing protein [Tropicibacter sp. R15_0]
MCTLCSATQTFDPARHPDGEPAFAVVIEGADAPSNTGTPYMMAVGDTFEGSLSLNDNDWVEVSLVAGQSYTLSMSGSSGGGGTLSDSYLYLTNSAGTVIAQNDDGGTGRDSLITFTATATGTYYLVAEAFSPSSQSGTYTLEVQATTVTGPSAGTLDELADYLTSGYWGGQQRSFDTSSNNQITVNITALTAAGQQLARWAFEAWEMVADIDFVETTGSADITFDDNQSGAFASSSFDGSGNILSSNVNVSASWLTSYGTGIDSYSFSTYVHEIGHALGLGHQGGYNGSASYPSDATFSNDSYQVSVMSYFSQTDNTSVNASYAEPISAMLADIVAIQALYGAAGAGSATAGNTTWGEGSSLGNYIDSLTNGDGNYGGGPVAFTVYDAGGTDLFDFSSSTQNQLIDLRAEQFSNINGLIGNVGIARGTIIENAMLGSGNDTIIGNQVANDIDAGGGADSVNGYGGNDVIDGEGGNDTILGGFGFDSIDGGAGADSLDGEGNADTLNGGAGNDTLIGGVGTDHLYGGDDNDSLLSGSEADRVYGGDGNDIIRAGTNIGLSVDGIWGEGGDDTLFGEGGYDLLSGGTGNDLLYGGNQADNLYGDEGNDTLYGGQGLDRMFGGDGNDLVIDTDGPGGLFGNAGNDTLQSGDGNDRFFGGIGNDVISSGGGVDTIYGGAGFDTINSGAGNDVISGNFNADTFIFEDGHGVDTITDFDATSSLETIDLSAVSAITSLADLDLSSATSGAATQVGADVVIDTGGGNSIRLTGVNITDLDATDFVF